MKRFAQLYAALDSSTRTRDKTRALVDYFSQAEAADAAWAVWFLTGNRPKAAVKSTHLHAWAAEAAALPDWLFAESYDAVGDLAETIALILPPSDETSDASLTEWVESRLLPLRGQPEDAQRAALLACWNSLGGTERFVFNKLITGGFRVGVSSLLVIRALAEVSGVDAKIIAHRLTGNWTPSPEAYRRLVSQAETAFDAAQPYPFFLAHPLEGDPAQLGDCGDWQAEWKWDGIRGQLVKRAGQVNLWSRGEELISAQFPEILVAAEALPGGVYDGEILAVSRSGADEKVRPFADLQKRLGRKNPGKKVLADTPVIFLAYDLLELQGEDWRPRPLHERRARLHRAIYSLVIDPAGPRVLQLSDLVRAPSWETLALAREESRTRGTEGLMLKRRDGPYGVGRTRGEWWKWKIEPWTLDCVLVYAQRGHGKRASLYTDYTFAIWRDAADGTRELVPFAKAYSGLSDAEIAEVDAFIRKNTLEKFGPVRTVKPELVFELAFEGIQRSARHKSGIAVRFPRMVRPRPDKKAHEADTLADILRLMGAAADGAPKD
jgi:DNA ligase 1